MSGILHLALIGFGEVGQTLADDLGTSVDVAAWDILFADPTSGPSRALAGRASPVRAARDTTDACAGADIVISAVTAAQTLVAAQQAVDAIRPGTWFLDLNSASPSVKRQASTLIENAAGRYVEAAVMSPIAPKRIATPILLGGSHAREFAAIAHRLSFTGATVCADTIGTASATKMCRSVLVKGIEALLAEALLTARHYGVERAVLDSLHDLFPLDDWPARARYMIGRSLQHGTRRAEEMREVARTVADAGVAPLMSVGAAERQDWAAGHRDALAETTLDAMLDAILARIAASAGDPARQEVPAE